jgi:site-specific DNA recombinase
MATATTKPTGEARAPTEALAVTKRAFAYLRVSSEGQTQTGYSRDGLSIEAQREAAADKAQQLGAEIVGEYSDPGKSAFTDLHKRTGFLAMLDELKRCNGGEATQINYVIVWATSRWARNTVDHFNTHNAVKAAGARLISITEPMIGENTPESFFMEGMFALNNQYESMKTGRNVKGGILQKAKAGGAYGGFRLGYVKGLETLPDGRQVDCVVPDPKRADLVTAAFQLYASGEYSLSELSDELYDFGLRSMPTRRYAEGKVGLSALQRMLRNPFYSGLIVYKRGTPDEQVFEGRHQALVDHGTFDHVQRLLDEKRTAGERPQVRRHFLRGSVYCTCGKRLTFGISTGKNGHKYPYFFCSSRVNGGDCGQRTNMRPTLIEDAIERYYVERPVQLTAEDVHQRTEAIESLVSVSQAAVQQVKQAKTALIAKLKAQQTRLIRLHAEEGDDISGDAFREERARMQYEIRAAEQSLAETEQRLQLDADTLRMALELAEDVAAVYEVADEQTKRGYNQAFFTKLVVLPEWDEEQGCTRVQIAHAELTEPYAALLARDLVPDVMCEVELIRRQAANTESGSGEPLSDTAFSIFVKLAEREGFEPSSEVWTPETVFETFGTAPHFWLVRGCRVKGWGSVCWV